MAPIEASVDLSEDDKQTHKGVKQAKSFLEWWSSREKAHLATPETPPTLHRPSYIRLSGPTFSSSPLLLLLQIIFSIRETTFRNTLSYPTAAASPGFSPNHHIIATMGNVRGPHL